MTDQTETARELLWRHNLPEDVIDGALCLHAQELAAVQREAISKTDDPVFYEGEAGWLVTLIEPDDAAAPAVPAGQAPDTGRAGLRDRIVDALLAPRYGGPQHNTPGGLRLTATPEEARRHRAGQIADIVLAVLPAPAECTQCGDAGACNGGPCPLAPAVVSAVPGQADSEIQAELEQAQTRYRQAEELLSIAHETSNRSEAERAAAVAEVERLGDWYRTMSERATNAEAAHDRVRDELAVNEADRVAAVARASAAEAAIARVRAVGAGLDRDANAPGVLEAVRPALRDAARQIRAALDGTEQPAAGAQQPKEA